MARAFSASPASWAACTAEVTADTKNILLEAAHFDSVSIARSARRHKIPSEASLRFERGVDTQLSPRPRRMAAELLTKFGNGEPSGHPTDVNTTMYRRPIPFKATEVARVAGLDVDVNRISDILTDVGCRVAGGGNGEFSVSAPTGRPDLLTSRATWSKKSPDWSATTRSPSPCLRPRSRARSG